MHIMQIAISIKKKKSDDVPEVCVKFVSASTKWPENTIFNTSLHAGAPVIRISKLDEFNKSEDTHSPSAGSAVSYLQLSHLPLLSLGTWNEGGSSFCPKTVEAWKFSETTHQLATLIIE